jgi:uncharacterized damage-inducible protein DinB
MDAERIVSLYDYGAWANARLLDQAAKLSEAEFKRQYSKGYQSIHETFVHLVSADRRWFARWQNAALPDPLAAAELPTPEAIRRRWEPIHAERRAYILGLTAADLEASIQFTGGRGTVAFPRWQGLIQCANHGTHHRSEIAAMLTDAGHSPGDIDYIFYCQPRR